MTSISSIYSYKNVSLCVYIGNTALLDEPILLNYCSHFGAIPSSSLVKEKFCDFHIIEFSSYEQLENFLKINIHEINRIRLDVKLYKYLLTNNDILNLDRKFFIGPILNSNDIKTIVQFYKIIDPISHNGLSKQGEQSFLLFEFSNRQSVTTIFEKRTIPVTIEHRKFLIYKPVHPKQFVNKIISMNNKQHQIFIQGLTNNMTETMLIEYFNKRAPVLGCHIFLNNSKYAVIEFNDEKTVKRILEIPFVPLQGTNLAISKLSRDLASLLSSSNDNDYDDEVQTIEPKKSVPEPVLSPLPIQNQTSLVVLPFIHQVNSLQQQLMSFINPTPSEPIIIPSPENKESGWDSPPRTVISQSPSMDEPATHLSLRPNATTTNSINTDSIYRSASIDTDVKQIKKIFSNNISNLVEKFQIELDQIKEDYMLKFATDRKYIEEEINQLINEEQQTFDKLNRYLNDHRRRVEKRNNNNNNNKRKLSPSTSTH